MVFPGKHSTGCMRCRRRKIKCDETKPACKRCSTYGRACPGYTDPFLFRPQNERIERVVSRARPTRTTLPTRLSRTSMPNALARVVSPRPSLTPCREQTSLCYFISRFVYPRATNTFPGHLSFLYDLYSLQDRGSLELATLSAAQMAAFNRFGAPELLSESYKNQNTAIRLLYKTLETGNGVIDDRTIGTVLLLCIVADLSVESHDQPNIHSPGLCFLLEKRGKEQLSSGIGIELYILAMMRLQIESFITNNFRYTDPGGFVDLLECISPFWHPATLVRETLRLRQAFARHVLSLQNTSDSTDDTVTRLVDTDASYATSLLNSSVQTLEDFDSWDHKFKDALHTGPGEAGGILLFRGSRIVLAGSLLTYCHRLKQLWADAPVPPDFEANMEVGIRQAIVDSLAAVQYAIGNVTSSKNPTAVRREGAAGLIIMYPISLIASCPYATPKQKLQCFEMLDWLKSSVGIKCAVGLVRGADMFTECYSAYPV
ncbi:hypothetical protein GQ53DRAFT_716393 [Thozetella sp. PMI_491]|nr:hypothetical protein GQ53DRAFT_716393 [Thozetella sp. PMI_491]